LYLSGVQVEILTETDCPYCCILLFSSVTFKKCWNSG